MYDENDVKVIRKNKTHTSNLSERGIFCWVTTVCGTTPRGDPTVGSGPMIVGIIGPGAKYGL